MQRKITLGRRKVSKVVFSDESNYEVINRKSRVLVKRLPNENYHSKFCSPRQKDGGVSAGIWGCLFHKGTCVCKGYKGQINQYTYKDTLENALLPSIELMHSTEQAWIFQQDGAYSHTAKSISK